MNKVLDNLKAWEAGAEARAAEAANAGLIEDHQFKMELARAKGPSKEQKKLSKHWELIFVQLGFLTKSCTLKPMEFVNNEPRVEEGVVYGNYGWQAASIKFPYYVPAYFNEVWSSGTGRWGSSKPTGKYNLKVGHHGNVKLFRELKDGSMKYSEIAAEIHHRLQMEERKAKAEAQRRVNKDSVEIVIHGLAQEFKSYSGVSLGSSADPEKPVYVKLDKTMLMTEAQAIELLDVLKGFGIG